MQPATPILLSAVFGASSPHPARHVARQQSALLLVCCSYYITLRSWAVLLSLAFWLLLGVRDVLCWRFLFITAS
jgi:hypothetical protein